MNTIAMRNLVVVATLALALTGAPAALGHDGKHWGRDPGWDRQIPRHSHQSPKQLGGFRIIIDDNDVTGISHFPERRKRGLFFIGDRHQHRFETFPERGHKHQLRDRFEDRWPNHKAHQHGQFRPDPHRNRAPGWSGRWQDRGQRR